MPRQQATGGCASAKAVARCESEKVTCECASVKVVALTRMHICLVAKREKKNEIHTLKEDKFEDFLFGEVEIGEYVYETEKK